MRFFLFWNMPSRNISASSVVFHNQIHTTVIQKNHQILEKWYVNKNLSVIN